MKKIALIVMALTISMFVNAQMVDSKTTAENNLKALYPEADMGDNSLFEFDKLTNSVKVKGSEVGKIKVVSVEEWVIIGDDGTFCFGATVVYYHTFLGVPICSGHIANAGICL